MTRRRYHLLWIVTATSLSKAFHSNFPLFGIRRTALFSFVDDSSFTPEQVQSLTVPQLKQQLRLRGLRVSGRKQELIDRLLAACDVVADDRSEELNPEVLESEGPSRQGKSKARKFAEDHGKELIDVTAYLDDEDKAKETKTLKTSPDEDSEEEDERGIKTGPEVWGAEARIVDDYEGRRVVVDCLTHNLVEFVGSNQTYTQAYVVASRDALKPFLAGGAANNQTKEEQLIEIQTKRERAAKVPVRFEDEAGLDEGDETGLYKHIIERDFSDWGKYTQTGAQLSASEVQGVLLLSDVYGAFTEDTRALAEKIAFECQPVVVMIPDLFRGSPWKEEEDGLNTLGQTYEEWRATHSDLRVSVDIRAAAACLRERYKVSSVVVWGTCYGGGRALEAAAGVLPGGNIHDVDGSVGPPPVDPMTAVAWYPTRYEAGDLFGENHKGTAKNVDGEDRTFAVMAVFAGDDSLPGATPQDAAELKSLLQKDKRIKDHMVKIFPGQDHGFAHRGLSQVSRERDDFEDLIDEEFGGAGRVSMDGSDAEVACLLSTAFMETYSRVFLPTVGPPVSKDKSQWNDNLEMETARNPNSRDVRSEIEDSLKNFVEEPLGGYRIDPNDDSQQEELIKLLRSMQNGQGSYKIDADDDLATVYAKLKASDDDFQLF